MKRLIGAHGHCPLAAREYAPFHMLPNSNAGLQRAASVLYGKQRRSKNLLPRVAEAWRPYRSVASWYLWKPLEQPDGMNGAYDYLLRQMSMTSCELSTRP